jgi:catechol 2,3-dioxygenase-like lactoylglutathione lyase family enzyme
MKITQLDHVNLRTSKLDEMVNWYADVLGLKSGVRPDFPFPGAWIYVGKSPVIHLVQVDEACASIEPKIEHFAFKATGMEELITHLNTLGVDHSVDPVPGMPITQINLNDIDGNHIHVDFISETT